MLGNIKYIRLNKNRNFGVENILNRLDQKYVDILLDNSIIGQRIYAMYTDFCNKNINVMKSLLLDIKLDRNTEAILVSNSKLKGSSVKIIKYLKQKYKN